MADMFIRSETVSGMADTIRKITNTEDKVNLAKFAKGEYKETFYDGEYEVSGEPEEGTQVLLGPLTVAENGRYTPPVGYDGFNEVTVDVPTVEGVEEVPEYDGKCIVTGTPTGEASGTLAINGVIRQYKVNAGANVNAGDFVEFVNKFKSSNLENISSAAITTCKLDNNSVLVINGKKAFVMSFHGTTVTVGENVEFTSEEVSTDFRLCAVSNTKVGLLWGSNILILTINGTNITVGSIYNYDESTMKLKVLAACATSDNKIFVLYRDPSTTGASYCYARIIEINETSLSFGSKAEGDYWTKNAVALSNDKILLSYANVTSSYTELYASICTISGLSVTVPAPTKLTRENYDSSFRKNSLYRLTNNKALFIYAFTALVLSIDNVSISVSNNFLINQNSSINPEYWSCCTLSSDKVLLSYNDYTYGKMRIITVEDDNVVLGTPEIFDYNTVTYNDVVAFSETSALVVYYDGLGAYSSVTIDGDIVTIDITGTGTFVQPATSNLHNVGVAATSGAEGETVDVYCVV